MGRGKLTIEKLENTSRRHVTYWKRSAGLMKKAKELSILCDIDILLLMFSPNGKPILCQGDRSNTQNVLAKFVQSTPQERFKRKIECLEVLKKTFKKLDNDIYTADLMGSSSQNVQELYDNLQTLQSQLSDARRKLSCSSDPENTNSLEKIIYMEAGLKQALGQIEMQKQPSNIQWLHDGDRQHFMLWGAPCFLPQRINFYSAETLRQGYNTCFVDEIQEVYSRHVQEESFSGLGQSSLLQLQLGSHHPYYFNGMNFYGDMIKANDGNDLQEDHAYFQVNGLIQGNPVFDVELRCGGVATSGLLDQRSPTIN